MSLSDDPADKIIENVAKGTAKGVLEWTAENLPDFIKQFKDKKLAFIEDSGTIESIKKQRGKSEWHYFTKYIKDPDLHILYQTGLTLREYEKEGRNYKPLLDKIFRKYGKHGLYVAWFAQNGLFARYIGNIIELTLSPEEIKKEINNLFAHIDNFVMFISKKHENRIKQKVGEIVSKIFTNSPRTFIISSIGGAITICEKVQRGVMQKIAPMYECELIDKEGKRIYILNQSEDELF